MTNVLKFKELKVTITKNSSSVILLLRTFVYDYMYTIYVILGNERQKIIYEFASKTKSKLQYILQHKPLDAHSNKYVIKYLHFIWKDSKVYRFQYNIM